MLSFASANIHLLFLKNTWCSTKHGLFKSSTWSNLHQIALNVQGKTRGSQFCSPVQDKIGRKKIFKNPGIDCEENSSPFIGHDKSLVVLSFVAAHEMKMSEWDVKTELFCEEL